MRSAALALAAVTATALLAGCGSSSGSGKDGDNVASLRKPGDAATPQGSGGPSAKKYKAGSKEAAQAYDAWHAEFRTCTARKAEQQGIEVVEGTGKDEGELRPKGRKQFVFGQDAKGNTTYDSPLTQKWFEKVIGPCRQEHPLPEADDDKGDAAHLAQLRKTYECLRGEGLQGLHEPTADAPELFTPEGTGKYLGDNPDPKAKAALDKCGAGRG
ncbi:hypothetical protein ACFY2W_15415 [Streptomyces sp. NPDC001262]